MRITLPVILLSTSARHRIMVIIKPLNRTSQMRRSSQQDTDMKYLMRASPDIKPPRSKSFRDLGLIHIRLSPVNSVECETHHINHNAPHIPHRLPYIPIPTHLPIRLINPKSQSRMCHRHDTRQPHRQEQSSPQVPPGPVPEFRGDTSNDNPRSEHRDLLETVSKRAFFLSEGSCCESRA